MSIRARLKRLEKLLPPRRASIWDVMVGVAGPEELDAAGRAWWDAHAPTLFVPCEVHDPFEERFRELAALRSAHVDSALTPTDFPQEIDCE